MGIYFMAAGKSSENRMKTLVRPWKLSDIESYLPHSVIVKLSEFFPSGSGIFAWGDNSENPISNVQSGEYVVDVRNEDVIQIFKFCFCFKSEDTRLQEKFGWDAEKPESERRKYRYVYFLSHPQRTSRKDKSFFGQAFGFKGRWLQSQTYFRDDSIASAMLRVNASTIEEFLGLPRDISGD